MSIVIRETQKCVSTIDHVLTDSQYNEFKTLSKKERMRFLSDFDNVLVDETIEPIGNSSVFRVRHSLNGTEKVLAERMTDEKVKFQED